MKTKRYGVNVGSSSILIIFVTVCLVSFAALSIVSANSDYKLTTKMADRSTNYYATCNQAYQDLAELDSTLAAAYASMSEENFYTQYGYELSYTYPLSSIQSLNVIVDLNYPSSDNDPLYRIREWRIITTGTLDYDESLPVFQ